MAAPALAASMADCAICAGVTGTAGLRPGVSAEPVTAHEIMTLRCIPASLATDVWLWRSLTRGWGRSPEVTGAEASKTATSILRRQRSMLARVRAARCRLGETHASDFATSNARLEFPYDGRSMRGAH